MRRSVRGRNFPSLRVPLPNRRVSMLSPHKAANETGAAALGAVPAEAALQHDHDRGWRRPGGTPSLAEVFGSIRTRPTGPLWRKLLTFLGPGYLVAVGYMDPGNWATSLAGGSKFGYALLDHRAAVEPDGDRVAGALHPARHRLAPRPGAGLPRRLPALCRRSALGARRVRHLRHRSGRGDRHGDRAQPPVRHSARDRRAAHRARRVSDPVDAAARLPLCRGLRGDAVPGHHRLLRHPDRHGRSRLGPGDPRLRADRRDRQESRYALSRARHHRRDGDAA